MNNQFLESTDSTFATISNNNLPLRGTDWNDQYKHLSKESAKKPKFDDGEQHVENRVEVAKELSKVDNDDDSDEEEKNGLGSFEQDYIVYQNQGESFPALIQLVQARLNRIQNKINIIKTTNPGQHKRPETFGNKQESLIVAVTPEQKTEIDKLVVQEESQQVFSLADMMNMMQQLLKFKKEAMDTKIANKELKI